MGSQKHQHIFRVWAILHYLEEYKNNPESCKLFDIQTYLRTNWAAAKELVEDLIEKKLVEDDIHNNSRIFKITESGRKNMVILHGPLSLFYDQDIQRFMKRARRY